MTQAKSNQRKGFEDSVGIEEFRGKYRFNFSRKLSRQYWGKTQQRMSTGLTVCKENQGKVEEMAWKIHYDVLSDNFNPDDLTKYGLGEKPSLTVITPIKKQLTILEIYDIYCESRKGTMAETTLELHLKGQFRQSITKAINTVSEDALAIRNWLVENRGAKTTEECLRHLDKAYQLGIKHKGLSCNPFAGMASEIRSKKSKRQNNSDNLDNEYDDSDIKAFSIDEVSAIIEAFDSSNKRKHFAPIIKFLFWTGCRTGEAVALKWRDIRWDKELIAIRRTYNNRLNKFGPTKTGVIRLFPMPKDGQLWNLLKSTPQRELDDVVFTSKEGKFVNAEKLGKIWRGKNHVNKGVIPELIEQGKVSQYLKLYATRHTFISHQVNIHKIPITTVAQWVGNGAMVSNNSYLDRDKMTVPGYSVTPSEAPKSSDNKPNSDESNQQLTDIIDSLTPEQIKKLKALLSN